MRAEQAKGPPSAAWWMACGGAVDFPKLKVGNLGDAQAAAVGDAQGGAVLQVCRMREQQRHFLRAQHPRLLLGRRIRAMRSPKPARPSVTWKKNRRAVLAMFMRE